MSPQPGGAAATTTDEQARQGNWIGAVVVFGLLGVLGYFSMAALFAVLVILFVVFMHEMGHFLTARMTGMKATEFFLGFGPRIFSFRRGETDFGFKPFLLGAYVKIIGMHSLDEVEPEDEAKTYRQQSYPRRVLVASAGSLMHFGMALIAMVALFAFVGDRIEAEDESWVVKSTPEAFADGSSAPAGSAGIEAGDTVVSVEGDSAIVWEDFAAAVKARPEQMVEVVLLRDGVQQTIEVFLSANPVDGTGRIGLTGGTPVRFETSGWGSVPKAVTSMPDLMWQSLQGVWAIFSDIPELADRIISPPGDDSANDNLATRPLSLVGAVQLGAETNGAFEGLFLFIAFNVFIGVFNLLPVLPLDGGHIAIATYERFREIGKDRRYLVDIARLMPMAYVVVMFLLVFGLGTIYLDIANPLDFSP
jgi:membrane-associated protease RseP (regulator of RpoE activity)